ncbi:MAG: hypothetical protein L6R30_23005 [Thermoanaerobaculia bacterium]|nr:hypothetical protein [Thermoanaerobaculia bacterium]
MWVRGHVRDPKAGLNRWTRQLLEKPLQLFRSFSVSPPDGTERITTYSIDPRGNRIGNSRGTFEKPTEVAIDGMFSRFFREGVSSHQGEYRFANVDKPVGYIKLQPATDPRLLGALTFDVKLNPAADRIPCYFLPWESKTIVEMTIPEKRTYSDEDDDPYLFFTAAINGCSVFVKGDPRHPTIAHLGISQGTTPYGNDAAQFWRDLYTAHRSSNGDFRGTVFEVNNTDYINQTGESGKAQTLNADRYKRWLDRMPPGPFSIEQVIPWGCVFGIRYGRLWSFYLQENATIQRYRLFKQSQQKTVSTTERGFLGRQRTVDREVTETVEVKEYHNVNRPMLVRPFFPGPGRATFEPEFRKV